MDLLKCNGSVYCLEFVFSSDFIFVKVIFILCFKIVKCCEFFVVVNVFIFC